MISPLFEIFFCPFLCVFCHFPRPFAILFILVRGDVNGLNDELFGLPRLRCHVVLSRTHLEAMAATGSLVAAGSDKPSACILFLS